MLPSLGIRHTIRILNMSLKGVFMFLTFPKSFRYSNNMVLMTSAYGLLSLVFIVQSLIYDTPRSLAIIFCVMVTSTPITSDLISTSRTLSILFPFYSSLSKNCLNLLIFFNKRSKLIIHLNSNP